MVKCHPIFLSAALFVVAIGPAAWADTSAEANMSDVTSIDEVAELFTGDNGDPRLVLLLSPT